MKFIDFILRKTDNERFTKRENFAVISGLIYLFIVSDAYFFWSIDVALLRIFIFALVCISSVLINNCEGTGLDKNKKPFFFSFLLYLILFILFRCHNISEIGFRILVFLPVLFIVCWPQRLLSKLYDYFFYIVLFFAFGSAIMSILGGLGLLQYVPYFELAPRSAVHERMGFVYRVYCGFLTLSGEMALTSIPRACGFLQEPGHFSITLGLVYIIERLNKNTPNVLLVLCGILTFSSNFILMAILVECVRFFKDRRSIKVLRYLFIVVIAAFISFKLLPKSIKQDVQYLFFERNLESVFQTYETTGSMQETLNVRINATGEANYNNFIKKGDMWLGKSLNTLDEEEVLSDYRGLIYAGGLVSLFAIILSIVMIVITSPTSVKVAILGALGLVIFHRSWMFSSSYLFLLAFIGVSTLRWRESQVDSETT